MKNREFKANKERYYIVESNNANWKWQAIKFDTVLKAWIRTIYYANTQAELKEIVREA